MDIENDVVNRTRRLYEAVWREENGPFQELLNDEEGKLNLGRCIFKGSSNYAQSLLHAASARGCARIIEILVDAAPQMCFAYDQAGNTPVHVAAMNGHFAVLGKFLEKRPHAVREPTSRGETVLHLCARFNHPDLLRSLLGIGPAPENGDLLDANENAAMASLAMAPCGMGTWSARARWRGGPSAAAQEFQEIIANGNLAGAQRLNNNGGNPQAMISHMKQLNRSMCLVRDQNGRNPIHVAATNGHIEVLKVLHRGNRYAAQDKTSNGESILHLCVKHSQFDALETLIKLNDDDGDRLINSKDNDGNTILHLAVTCKQLKMVDRIVEVCKSCIEINAINNKHMTVLDVSMKQWGNERIRELLKRNGAELAEDNDSKWLESQSSALMVVASLIATIAFQVGFHPQKDDTKRGIEGAGVAIWSYLDSFSYVTVPNTLGFVASLAVIAVLMSGMTFSQRIYSMYVLKTALWIALIMTYFTFTFSSNVVGGSESIGLGVLIIVIVMVSGYVN